MEAKVLAVFLAAFAAFFVQVSGEKNTYVGAVVEYTPALYPNEEKTVAENVEEYAKLMAEAKKQGAEIIVFPEYGLGAKEIMSVIPHPAAYIIPHRDTTFQTSKAVKDLSKASKDNSIYSVVNLVEKRVCAQDDEDCPPKGYYKYNTNVVFDREGAVIARYAKYNLFDESLTDRPPTAEIAIFDTDFGVRFGTFICFDILFRTPAQQLVRQFKITDFVFTTYWFSELPFLTALQAQAGWAETNNVNLLASGVSNPSRGSGGSGIFNGRYGSLVQMVSEKKTRKLLVATIPKLSPRDDSYENRNKREVLPVVPSALDSAATTKAILETDPDEEFFFLADQMFRFVSSVVPTDKVYEETLCSHTGFCCSFKVTGYALKEAARNYTFRAVAYNGPRSYGQDTMGAVQVCGVVLCNGPHVNNCTSRVRDIPGLFKFQEIEIRGSDFSSENAFQMPSTLSDGKTFLPLPANKYSFTQTKVKGARKNEVALELLWPVTDLHTFGIYGRDFTRDGEQLVVAGAGIARAVPVVLAAFAGFLLFIQ